MIKRILILLATVLIASPAIALPGDKWPNSSSYRTQGNPQVSTYILSDGITSGTSTPIDVGLLGGPAKYFEAVLYSEPVQGCVSASELRVKWDVAGPYAVIPGSITTNGGTDVRGLLREPFFWSWVYIDITGDCASPPVFLIRLGRER